MELEVFGRILDKAISEIEIPRVALYNWTEPLLHPELPDLIRAVRERGQGCAISTNLNRLPDPDGLMAARPEWLRVSVSGYRQHIYERGHAGGNVERVRENMRRLAHARDRVGGQTALELFYHRYVDNQADEDLMRTFAEGLGFRFLAGWAHFSPVEKVLAVLDPGNFLAATLTSRDRAVLERLAMKLEPSARLAAQQQANSCDLLDNGLALDVHGNVLLCCAAASRPSNVLGPFLKLSIDEIQAARGIHRLCEPCMKQGLPVLFTQGDSGFDEIAETERRRWQERATFDLSPKKSPV
jgi:hypothetical protein